MAQQFTITAKDAGQTLKNFFLNHYPALPYPLFQIWLRKGEIKLNGKKTHAQVKLTKGDLLKLPPSHFFPETEIKPAKLNSINANKKLQAITVHTEKDFSVINKPANLAVQGGSGIKESLDDWLKTLNQLTGKNYKLVHRLDQETSGLMLIAHSTDSAQILTRQFQDKTIAKTYLAVCHDGLINKNIDKGVWQCYLTLGKNYPLSKQPNKPTEIKPLEKMIILPNNLTTKELALYNAQLATTDWQILSRNQGYLLMQLHPLTGRKHQLRVTLSHYHCPIVGDKKYGLKNSASLPKIFPKNRLLLHAKKITLANGQTFQVNPPDYFPISYFTKPD